MYETYTDDANGTRKLSDAILLVLDRLATVERERDRLYDLVEYAYRESRADNGLEFAGPDADAAWQASNAKMERERV